MNDLDRLYETRGELIEELKGMAGMETSTPYADRIEELKRVTRQIDRMEGRG